MTDNEFGHLTLGGQFMPVIFSEEQRREIEKNIKSAALKMFEEKGIKNTTVAEIAKSVGIAKGTFYNFFESKGALIISIVDDYDQKLYARIYKQLGSDKKMPADDFYKIYSSVFTPENTFFCHIDAKDIEWMKNDDNTKVLFESERACDFCAWLY